MREPGRPADEARDRPARPLADRRRPAPDRARGGRPGRDRAAGGRGASSPLADACGHALELDVDDDAWALADEERVLQIGRALTGNALAHTPAGTTVRLRVEQRGEPRCARGRGRRPRHRARAPRPRLRALLPRRRRRRRRAAASASRSPASSRGGWAARVDRRRAARARRCSRSSCRPSRRRRCRPAAGRDGQWTRARYRFHVKTARAPTGRDGSATVRRGARPAVIALAAVAAVIGAGVALASAAGSARTEAVDDPVVVAEHADEADAPAAASRPLGNRFDPAAIYARRAPGVVTLYADLGADGAVAGLGIRRRRDGHDPDERARDHERADQRRRSVKGAEKLYVEFRDGDRVPATIVGWDLFNDVGAVRVDPADHAVSPCRSATRRRSSSANRWRRSAARSGSRTRSRSASSRRPAGRSTRSPRATRRRRYPDRRPDQPRQLRRPALRRAWPVIGINAQIRSTSGTRRESDSRSRSTRPGAP